MNRTKEMNNIGTHGEGEECDDPRCTSCSLRALLDSHQLTGDQWMKKYGHLYK